MILHKDCLPIARKWLDKQDCTPFVFPWEVQLTDHFGLEHLASQEFVLTIELVNDAGMPAGDITDSFNVTIGLDSEDKNVFVAVLKEYPETMPVNFRLMVTIKASDAVVYSMVTESYVFLNDQCISAYTINNNDWGAIANGGRLVVNGERIAVTITGSGLPSGFTFGVNGARQESSISVESGLVYEIYGEDQDGNQLDFTYAGMICNKGEGFCNQNTVLIEGRFDCMAPDGRFTGSVLPHDDSDPDVRYRYLIRLYADIIEMPADITRTIAINNKTQRTERIKRFLLVSYAPMSTWLKDEMETMLMGSNIYIQGREYVFTTGKPTERQGVPGTTGWWLKADLEQVVERKDYSCEVVCQTCLKPTGLGFTILPDSCIPLTGLQATVTPDDQGTVTLMVTASTTDMATSYKIGYRVQGGPTFTYVTPNPIALPYSIIQLPNAIYEVEVTKITADDMCAPMTAVSNATELNPFDYLVVRYIWTDLAGRDLDTFTGFINTGTVYDNDWVGFGQGDPKVPGSAPDATAYLFWASDNTASGVEAVLINPKQFVIDNPGTATEIQVRLNAVWWSQRLTGDVQVQLTTYLGGTMSKSGFDFVNTGGVLVDSITLGTNVDRLSTSKNIADSTNVAIARYNKTTKTATIQLI